VIVGLTIFMMSDGWVKCAPKAWRSSSSIRVLKQRAENFRLNFGPVELGGFTKENKFLVANLPIGPVVQTTRR